MVYCNLLTTMYLTSFSTIKIKFELASFGFEKITYISEMFESINMHLSQKKQPSIVFKQFISSLQRSRYSSDLVRSF